MKFFPLAIFALSLIALAEPSPRPQLPIMEQFEGKRA
ncbi:MAG: hypothetical protein RLZ97_1065 [Verrucomicrobiota bacterium]